MKRVWLGLVVIISLPGFAHAASLWQVWQAARANDPAFRAASARLRAAATARPAALALLLPQVAIAASAGPQTQYFSGDDFYGSGFESITESQHLNASTWQATLTQTLFDWRRIKSYQATGFAVQSAAATYQATLEHLTARVITDDVAVLTARADLQALQQAARGFGAQYRDAEARYRAGLSGIIGADEAHAADQSIQAQVIEAQARLIAARETLAAVTGNPAIIATGGLPPMLDLPPPGTIGSWLNRAQAGNPTLAAARLTARDDTALVAAARGSYLPNISLQLQHAHVAQAGRAGYAFFGQRLSGPGYSLQQGNSVTVQMNWTIFAGGATKAATDRARAIRDEALANAATSRLDVIRTVRTDYFAVVLDQARLTKARSAARIAAKAVQAAADGVRAGLISESDLIADRQQLLAAQLALHQAILSAITHEVGLAEAAGSATPQLVRQISTILALPQSSRSTDHG